MKKIISVVVGMLMLLMLSGVSLSAEPAAPAKQKPTKIAKQKPAKECKVKKQHLKLSELTKGAYVSVQGGVAFRQDSDVNNGSVAIDDGFAYGVAAGYRLGAFHKRLRVEGEIGYQKNDIDGIDNARRSASVSGDMKAYTFLVNGYYDFVFGKKIVPYLTAGIGVAKVDADVNDFAHVDDTGLAYQVGAGIAYHISDNWHIDLKYRYLAVAELSGIEIDSINPEFATHNVFLGLRYRF